MLDAGLGAGIQALLPACPENSLRRTWDNRVQEFCWVTRLNYENSASRSWKLNALECTETTTATGVQQYFAGLTALPVNRKTVEEIAQQGGRDHWKIEHHGFNRQKNRGLNLEHVYSGVQGALDGEVRGACRRGRVRPVQLHSAAQVMVVPYSWGPCRAIDNRMQGCYRML